MALPQSKTPPAMQKLLLLKSKIPFFKGLTNQDIIALIENVRIIQYKEGDILFKEGCTRNKDIYYLLKGKIDVIKHIEDTNEELKLVTLDKPTLFGEMRAITDEPRSTTIASGEGGALIISFNKVESLDQGKALLYKNIIDELSAKLSAMNEERR